MGAWIETVYMSDHVHGDKPSLPAWERGLKPFVSTFDSKLLSSLPAWERGLKHLFNMYNVMSSESLPAWERGLKPTNPGKRLQPV